MNLFATMYLFIFYFIENDCTNIKNYQIAEKPDVFSERGLRLKLDIKYSRSRINVPDMPDKFRSCKIFQIILMVTKYVINFTMVIKFSIKLKTVIKYAS